MPILFFEVAVAIPGTSQIENQVIVLDKIIKITRNPNTGKEDQSVIYFAKDHHIVVDEKLEDLKHRIVSVNPPR